MRYPSQAITVWTLEGRIDEIRVRAPYAGQIYGVVGIGSKIGDGESAFGSVTDDDDNLVVARFPGWCFEMEKWMLNTRREHPGVHFRDLRLSVGLLPFDCSYLAHLPLLPCVFNTAEAPVGKFVWGFAGRLAEWR